MCVCGGGVRVQSGVLGGQGECERRIEVIVKMQKIKNLGGGGEVRSRGEGVSVDVNEELKLL